MHSSYQEHVWKGGLQQIRPHTMGNCGASQSVTGCGFALCCVPSESSSRSTLGVRRYRLGLQLSLGKKQHRSRCSGQNVCCFRGLHGTLTFVLRRDDRALLFLSRVITLSTKSSHTWSCETAQVGNTTAWLLVPGQPPADHGVSSFLIPN